MILRLDSLGFLLLLFGRSLDETHAYLSFVPKRRLPSSTPSACNSRHHPCVVSSPPQRTSERRHRKKLFIINNNNNNNRNWIMSLFSTQESTMNTVGSNSTQGDENNDIIHNNNKNDNNNNNNKNPNDSYLVNDESWQVYEGIMRQVMTASRVLKKDKLESMKAVHDFILSNHPARVLPAAAAAATPTTTPISDNSTISTISSTQPQHQEESPVVDAVVVQDNGDSNNNNNNSTTTTGASSTSSSTTSSSATTTMMRAELHLQRRTFMETYQWTLAQYDYAVRCLTYIGDFCAKNQTIQGGAGGGGGGGRRGGDNPIVVAWHKLKECGMIPKENCISTYMYVLSLDEDNNDNNADNDDNDNRNDVSSPRNNSASSVLMEVATFHDLLFPPNEKTITLRIKSLIAQGNVQEAEAILQSLPDEEKDGTGGPQLKRLRTFLPVLEHYCSVGDTSSILRLFRQMQCSSGVHFDADSYALIIGALARNGAFRNDSQPIPGAFEAGYSAEQGPLLFDEIVEEMALDIMELSEMAAQTIYQSLQQGFLDAQVDSTFETSLDHSNEEDDTVAVVPTILELSHPAVTGSDSVLVGRVTINDSTAICPSSGAKLRLLKLDDAQRKHVHDTLLTMAKLQHQEFIKNSKKKVTNNNAEEENDHGLKELSRYSEWLEARQGKPFTAIVDGPNIAYFGHANLRYSQIRLVVDELERMGEVPLVTMPEKYVARRFWLSLGKMQELSQSEIDIMEGLLNEGKMYVVPTRCLDDYYWMLASVANQTVAREQNGHCRLVIPPNDDSGRLPGLRPLLISNDQMRDHKLDLLEPREFRRWCSCHIVNYNISSIGESESEKRQVELRPADFFSREIQGNNHGSGEGLVWHFPVSEWAEPDRLCIYINR